MSENRIMSSAGYPECPPIPYECLLNIDLQVCQPLPQPSLSHIRDNLQIPNR